MNVSDQVDALQERAAELKSSFEQARRESREQVKARINETRADIAARQGATNKKAQQAAGRAQSGWKAMQADAAAKMQALQDRIDRKREQNDAKMAEQDAEFAEVNASDALDYAAWAVEQAELAVLDAVDARASADAQAAAAPPS